MSSLLIGKMEFNNLYLKTYTQNSCIEEKILYLNDRYIITDSDLIYGNSSERIFYKNKIDVMKKLKEIPNKISF
jgi:hypothetical protein